MPGILAATALMGVLGFVFCGFMAWLIFSKQDELAIRSLEGSFIPAVEQSLLEPEEKKQMIVQLEDFVDELKRGQLEGWQVTGVMQRLSRLPILQWGQIRAVERFVDANPDAFAEDASLQFDRLRRGVERNDITAIDFRHILSPVLQGETAEPEPPLIEPLEIDPVQEVVQRARIVADRSVPEALPKSDVSIDTIVRRQIEAGLEQGSF
jgi:hypothetical protein